MSWREARRRRAELLRVLTAEIERAEVVFGRLLLIRSIGGLRASIRPIAAGPDWASLAVAAFFVRCGYRQRIAVPSSQDRAIAQDLGLEFLLAMDHDLSRMQEALRRVADAYLITSASFNVVEIYKDPDLHVDERASTQRYVDLGVAEKRLQESLGALPEDLPDTAPAGPILDEALRATVRRMAARDLGYSPYSIRTNRDADRWPEWLAGSLLRCTTSGSRTFPTPTREPVLASLLGARSPT